MWVGPILSVEDLNGRRPRSPKDKGILPLDRLQNQPATYVLPGVTHYRLACPASFGLASPHNWVNQFLKSHSFSLSFSPSLSRLSPYMCVYLCVYMCVCILLILFLWRTLIKTISNGLWVARNILHLVPHGITQMFTSQ